MSWLELRIPAYVAYEAQAAHLVAIQSLKPSTVTWETALMGTGYLTHPGLYKTFLTLD